MTNEVKNDKSAEEVFEMEAHEDGMKIVIVWDRTGYPQLSPFDSFYNKQNIALFE